LTFPERSTCSAARIAFSSNCGQGASSFVTAFGPPSIASLSAIAFSFSRPCSEAKLLQNGD